MDTLALIKARLGITTTKRDDYLEAITDGIKSELESKQGIKIDESSADEKMFLVDYVCYRYENKGSYDGMPRHLQWRLHNLFVKV